MHRLEQAICNSQFLFQVMSTNLCQSLEYGTSVPYGGDASSGCAQVIGDTQDELHASFYAFHEAWRKEKIGSQKRVSSMGAHVSDGIPADGAPSDDAIRPGVAWKTLLANLVGAPPHATDAELESAAVRIINCTESTPLPSLPSEHRVGLRGIEDAVFNASATIELLALKIVAEARGGENYYEEPRWLSAIQTLASKAIDQLHKAFDDHAAEVQRLHWAELPTVKLETSKSD